MAVSLTGGERVLAALRRRGDEARWTQAIAAVAAGDPGFAAGFARALLAASHGTVAGKLTVPDELECRAEVSVRSGTGANLGRVDLVFEDDRRTFCLYVELKLHSGYGEDQLGRYRRALDTEAADQTALIAITTATALYGEEVAEVDPRWLGSIRWSQIYESLRALPVADPSAGEQWRAALAVLRAQGDFGDMDIDIDAMRAWARYREAEDVFRRLLRELVQPAQTILHHHLDATTNFELERPNQPVIPWELRPHLAFRIPAECGEERLRIQFAVVDGETSFTVEARYEHPKESTTSLAVQKATATLEGAGYLISNDGYGHHWARIANVEEFAHPTDTLERLIAIVREAISQLVASGIFDALQTLQPTTPPSLPPAGL